MALTYDERERRRAAKAHNERVKLFATLLNNVGIAIAAGAVIVPFANSTDPNASPHWIWFLGTVCLSSRASEPSRSQERGLRHGFHRDRVR